MATVASLNVLLTANTGPFSKAMLKVSSTLQNQVINKMNYALPAAIAAATAAIGTMVHASFTAIDSAREWGLQLGVTVKQFDAFVLIAQQANLAEQDITSGLEKMIKAIAEANDATSSQAKAFQALGLSQEQLSQESTADAFRDIANALAAVKNPYERAALAQEIFGRGGQKIARIMKDGSVTFDDAVKQIDQYGVVSEKGAADVDELGDSLVRLKRSFRGLSDEMVARASPALADTANFGADNLRPMLDGLISTSLRALGPIGQMADAYRQSLFPPLQKTADAAGEAEQKFDAMSDAMKDITDRAKEARDPMQQFLKQLQLQVDTFGMSADRAKIYEMALGDATTAQLEQAQALVTTMEAMEKQQRQQEDMARQWQQLDDQMLRDREQFFEDMANAGERWFDETRTPAERLQAQIEELNSLFEWGAIDAETYERALNKLKEQMDESSGLPQSMEFGSQAAESALNRSMHFANQARGGDGAFENAIPIFQRIEENTRRPAVNVGAI